MSCKLGHRGSVWVTEEAMKERKQKNQLMHHMIMEPYTTTRKFPLCSQFRSYPHHMHYYCYDISYPLSTRWILSAVSSQTRIRHDLRSNTTEMLCDEWCVSVWVSTNVKCTSGLLQTTHTLQIRRGGLHLVVIPLRSEQQINENIPVCFAKQHG